MTSTEPTTAVVAGAEERTALLKNLGQQRFFLRFTVRDLTDEQAAATPTASALCLGGLIKHVTSVERGWANFIVNGPSAMALTEESMAKHDEEFRMLEGDTLAGVLEEYEQVAKQTDELVASLPDLNADQPLPEAPWFEPNARWSARTALLHICTETAHHAGHADIIRESIDGAKTMG